MKINTQNELAALIAGVRLGNELGLHFAGFQDGEGYIDDSGVEGWCVKIIDGVLVPWCADDNNNVPITAMIHKAQYAAEQHYAGLDISEELLRPVEWVE